MRRITTLLTILILALTSFTLPIKVSAEVKAVDYGAICDGVNDDTTSIQNAMNAGDVVILPSGTCLVTDLVATGALIPNTGNTLKGEGINSTTIKLANSSDNHVISMANITDVTIRDLTIDANSGNNIAGHAIRGNNVSNIRVQDVFIKDVPGYGLGFQDGTNSEIFIEDVKISNTGSDAIDFKNPNHNNVAIFIDNVYITNPTTVGIDIRGVASITNVYISGIGSGETGIRFRENGVASVGTGGHFSELSNFYMEADSGADYGIYIPASKVVVSNGVIKGGFTIGVYLAGTFNSVSNVTTDTVTTGFFTDVDAQYAKFTSCTARTGTTGFDIKSDYTVVNGVIGNNQSTTGIRIQSTADITVVDGSIFRSNGGGAIKSGTNLISGDNYGF